jgi:nicotinamide-nucleotide amidase
MPEKDGIVVSQLAQQLTSQGLSLATAESCTGGGLAYALTAIAGSSTWFMGGVVSYSNAAKHHLLHVDTQLLHTHGAVSEPVVLAMAKGAQQQFNTDCAIATSGIAGPGGGSIDKPVGSVWLAWVIADQCFAELFLLPGDRAAVRAQSISICCQRLLDCLTRKTLNR